MPRRLLNGGSREALINDNSDYDVQSALSTFRLLDDVDHGLWRPAKQYRSPRVQRVSGIVAGWALSSSTERYLDSDVDGGCCFMHDAERGKMWLCKDVRRSASARASFSRLPASVKQSRRASSVRKAEV